jgi:hypothetical protein
MGIDSARRDHGVDAATVADMAHLAHDYFTLPSEDKLPLDPYINTAPSPISFILQLVETKEEDKVFHTSPSTCSTMVPNRDVNFLDEGEFSAASAFVAASSISIPEEAQLRLYSFYKFVTKPSTFKLKELVPIWNADEGIDSGLGGMHVSVRDLNAAEVLAETNTVLNAKHIEGHWTLQYVVVCDGEDVAAWLVQHHIDLQIKDMVLNTLTNTCFEELLQSHTEFLLASI